MGADGLGFRVLSRQVDPSRPASAEPGAFGWRLWALALGSVAIVVAAIVAS